MEFLVGAIFGALSTIFVLHMVKKRKEIRLKRELQERENKKNQEMFRIQMALGKLEHPGLSFLGFDVEPYRHVLDHEATELPPLVVLAEKVFAKHTSLDGNQTPEQFARWLYYLVRNAKRAEMRLQKMLDADEPPEPRYLKNASKAAAERGMSVNEYLEAERKHFDQYTEAHPLPLDDE